MTIPNAKWAADNDCYTLGENFDSERYIRFLERCAYMADTCLFATAPDVVGDAEATINLFQDWRRTIRNVGLPVALVGQDGLENTDIPWLTFDALFIGGTTEWKLGRTVREIITKAKARGKWVHIGRVNSAKRLRYCIAIGADSVDGTEWAINPGRGIRWAGRVMRSLKYQPRLL